MTEHNSDSRRQRLRELQEKHASQADGDDRDDKKNRIRQALGERQNRRMQNSDDGQRPLERFPKLREALMKRRQSGEGGDHARGGKFKGRRRGGGDDRDSNAVMFARRYIDTDEPAGADDEDIDGSMQRLQKRAEMLKSELFEIVEEISRLKQLKQEQEADRHDSGDGEAPGT